MTNTESGSSVSGPFFAGIIAGEGCFQIAPNNAGQSWQCMFTLAMRADDTDLVRSLRNFAECGVLYPKAAQGRAKPQVVWTVNRVEDCRRLVEALQPLPLMNKKSGDYRIWAEAVARWSESQAPHRRRYSDMARLADELRAHRDFDVRPRYIGCDIAPAYVDGFLAGFATAEAHFGATVDSGHPLLTINLRLDDRAVLDYLNDYYGLGHIKVEVLQTRGRDVASWRVTKLDETAQLLAIFDRSPPRGRQGNVYREWRELVRYAAVRGRGRKRTAAERQLRRKLAWRVRVQRAYRAPPALEVVDRAAERTARCLAALRAWRDEMPAAYTATEYDRYRRRQGNRLPDRNTIARTFGSWRAALVAAGLPTEGTRPPEVIAASAKAKTAARAAHRERQRLAIVEAVRLSREELGHWPAALEFMRWRLECSPASPSQMTIYKMFPGGWEQVLAAAREPDGPVTARASPESSIEGA
jgi:hypothetical protein